MNADGAASGSRAGASASPSTTGHPRARAAFPAPWAQPLEADRLPLLAPRDPRAPLAWRHGAPLDAARYLADARALAARLPGRGPVANLCTDRYAFAVALAAALLSGRPSLLPPDARADTLDRLRAAHPGLVPLTDADVPGTDPAGPPDPAAIAEASGTAGSAADDPAVPAVDALQEAARLLTSGSTGAPQPHAKRWRTLWSTSATGARRLAALLGRPTLAGLTLVGTVPPQHSYGFESTVLLGLLGGAAFECGRPFYPADIAQALASVPRPRGLVTTPFHLKTLLRAGIALPPADVVLSATAPLSPQLAQQAEQAFGGLLVEIYGCTEAGQVAMRRTAATDEWHAFDGLSIRAQAGAAAPGAEPGAGERFVVEGGDLPGPQPLADLLALRDATHFRLLGRANDLIHVAGRRSSLGHLDFHLNSIPGVEDGAFWLPDEVADGVVRTVAFVVAPGLDAAAIVAALRDRLEPAFVPRRVVHLPALPREATGKLTRRTLRAMAEAAFGPAAAPAPAAARAVVAGDGARDAAAPAPADAAGPAVVELRVPHDHPAFAGHFPGQPLLPGALLLAEVLEAVRGRPALAARLGDRPVLAAAKFLAPVRPGAALSILLEPEAPPSRGLRFAVRQGAVTAASGRWTPEAASPDAGARASGAATAGPGEGPPGRGTGRPGTGDVR